MQVHINNRVLELVQGDITQEATDAIVNAANSSLMGGGGVDGAIHRAAGPDLLKETRQLGGCETGNAKISGGYRLKARHVIHAVGPVYQSSNPDVPHLLTSAYQTSLELAAKHQLNSVAFPAISTGIHGYPMREAAKIALQTTLNFLQKQTSIQHVRFVLFTPDALDEFCAVLDDLTKQ